MLIGNVQGGGTESPKTVDPLQRAQMTKGNFLKLLVSEISNQNPLEPMDNGQFLSQLVDMQNLETTASLESGIRSFEKFSQLSAASSLIGKTVAGKSSDGSQSAGVVERVTMDGNGVNLVVNGSSMSLDAVTEIVG